jgi:hypothetical protein
MYNRYIPQPDGSFRRNYTPDKSQSPPPQQPSAEPKPPCPQPLSRPEPEQCCPPSPPPEPPRQKPCHNGQSVSSFLKNLLPKGFDTADLLIVLLLLLMAGDSPDDQNSALLTLALYLFM